MNVEIDNYIKSLCLHLRVDVGVVRDKSQNNKGRFIRHLVVQKFSGIFPQKEIAEYLNITPSSVAHLKLRFKKSFNNNYEFQECVRYLEELGVMTLPKPPRTKDISDRLNLTLDQIDRTIEMLKKQKDEIYEIKKSLPQIW